ncbi:39S ribosomal protein L30, mitochondrial [Rhinatrema bivittatum]|uniref:39S ribosomal protein L30, mitochondrial n=1 Tax=Rhinatrema bivittatum TaxID=194408 RepID=UPI001129DB56|nr:39S ribosomal protein L30, mitochondrial [Rhinatrema bivittatum]
MAAFNRTIQKHTAGLKNLLGHGAVPLTWSGWVRPKYTKPRVPNEVFQPHPSDHAKYGGDPQQPHKLHLITRIKTVISRPYWEKKIIHDLGLDKAHQPVVHKNIPAVNSKLKVIKHLIRIKPLKLPHGLPTDEEMSDTYLKSTGELVIRRRLQPLEKKSIES